MALARKPFVLEPKIFKEVVTCVSEESCGRGVYYLE